MKPTLILLLNLLLVPMVYCQSLIITPDINLPKDTSTRNQLITSLNSFLDQRSKPNSENQYVLKEERRATYLLLNEMKNMEKNAALKDDNFYKPYVQNIMGLKDDSYIIQLSFMGIKDKMPVVRSSYRLMAKKADGSFYFYSPLKQNTQNWKVKKLGVISYHYKDTIDMGPAKAYFNSVSLYDKKLNAQTHPIDVYYCDDLPEVMQTAGIDYKLDYNGLAYDALSVRDVNTLLEVNGWNSYGQRFDTHDLFHERLRMVVNPDVINRPVDEGCAYLYGGSWGIYKWADILSMFKKYAADNPNADWLTLYINDKNKNFAEGQRPLKISYAINALIARKYDREKGIAPMPLLTCGKMEKGDENYFKALEKLTGITKATFNAEVWKLIQAD